MEVLVIQNRQMGKFIAMIPKIFYLRLFHYAKNIYFLHLLNRPKRKRTAGLIANVYMLRRVFYNYVY